MFTPQSLALVWPILQLLLSLQTGEAAGAAPSPITATPVHALAAWPRAGGVVIVTDEEASVVDKTGARLVRLWDGRRRRAAVVHPVRRTGNSESWSNSEVAGDAAWARATDLEDLDDPDDPRLVDQQRALEEVAIPETGRRADEASARPAAVAALPRPACVAVAGETVWMGGTAGLRRVSLQARSRLDRAQPIGGAGTVSHLAVSGDGEAVVVVKSDGVYRSSDGGETFALAAPGRTTARTVLVSHDGTVAFLEADGGPVLMLAGPEVGPTSTARLSIPGPITAAAVAGDADLLVMNTQTLYRVHMWGKDSREIDAIAEVPPDATQLAAAEDGGTVAAASEDFLYIMTGMKTPWLRAPLPGLPLTGLAVVDGAVFIATAGGLMVIPVGGGDDRAARGDLSRGKGVATGALRLALHAWGARDAGVAVPAWWTALLPRLDLLFATALTSSRREFRGLLVLTFSLEGRRADDVRQAARLLRTARGELAAGWRGLEYLPPLPLPSTDDPISAEERKALTRAMQETP